MSNLSRIFLFKISATLLFWSVPLILFPLTLLEQAGLPSQSSYMFVRLLGWAYLSLCVAPGPIWVGIVSNGGACVYLATYGFSGAWVDWGGLIQFIAWASVLATAAITIGLYTFGVRGQEAPITG
jgi:hypothetical protein